ncbi:hypothetical protein BJ741DRAFT_666474 [Chytriomyces cf. hyalinus JEL632]|nr:hypothetical protein BJ741DRAFT_666474 [Chytriomyces cf. hyalinus JEL632]
MIAMRMYGVQVDEVVGLMLQGSGNKNNTRCKLGRFKRSNVTANICVYAVNAAHWVDFASTIGIKMSVVGHPNAELKMSSPIFKGAVTKYAVRTLQTPAVVDALNALFFPASVERKKEIDRRIYEHESQVAGRSNEMEDTHCVT